MPDKSSGTRLCPKCGDISDKRDVVNNEVDRCLKCKYEGYVWSFKPAHSKSFKPKRGDK